MNKLIPVSLFIALAAMPAIARPAEQTIKTVVDQSTLIEIPEGSKAYRVWMDDADFADIDTDKPIEQGVNYVYLVPRRTGKSRITIITRDSHGKDKPYSLFVAASPTGNSPSYISVAPQKPAKRSQYDLAALRRGLSTAVSSGKVSSNSLLHRAFEGAIADIEGGASPSEAARRNNIYVTALDKLASFAPAPRIKENPKTGESSLLARLRQLETRVDRIDAQQKQLEQEQQEFLAQLKQFDQSLIALSDSMRPANVYRIGGDIVKPAKKVKPSEPAVTVNLPPVDSHTIANSLIRGLPRANRENVIPYLSWEYRQINSAVRLLRRGNDLKAAIAQTGASKDKIETLLSWADIDVQRAGL